MLRRFIDSRRFFLWLAGLFVFLRLPSLFEPYWYGDEGIYLVLGQGIRKGLTLYSQIHDNKPPTLYYLAALGQTVFGFRLLLAFFIAGAVYFFHLLSQKFLAAKPSRWATIVFLVLSSIPFIEGNIANAEVFMLLPTIMAFYLFYSQPISSYLFLVTGLLLGFAFTIKVPVFIEFAFLCFWLLAANLNLKKFQYLISSYLLLVSSFLAPTVLYLIYFWKQDALNQFLFAALLQNFGYLSSWSTGSHSGSATSGGVVSRGIILLLTWLILFLLHWRKKISREVFFVSAWLAAAIFGSLLSTRPYPHYLIQLLPPLILTLVLLFQKRQSLATLLTKALMVSAIVLVVFKYHFYFYPTLSYYRNFYSHIFSLNSPEYRSYFGGRVNDTYRLADYLKSSTTINDKIFIWGDEPYIYALSNRLPVGRYTVAYHIADFNQYDSTYEELKTVYPKYIVYYPNPSRPYPQLDKFISSYYLPAEAIGDAIIYRSLP